MLKFFSMIILTFSSMIAQAGSHKALQVLKSMMPKVCHFSGEFTQSKQLKTIPVPLISTGQFIYSCDLGLIWNTQKPINESLVFTNKKLHFLVSDKLSVENLKGVQHDFLANLLLSLMAGNTDFISKEFDLTVSENEQYRIKLEPKSKMIKQAIESVVLQKRNEKNGLEIIITDKNHQRTQIISSEKQQFTNNEDFLKSCHSFATNSCKLLINPVRINTSGKN